jgi:phosphoglycolate phosphatase-like HAD superfamily hydrolase
MAILTIKESNIKTIIFDFDGTLAKLNIDFDLLRKTLLENDFIKAGADLVLPEAADILKMIT